MTATRLSIYNDALLIIGERALSSLTEEREPRRLLDQVWNNDGVLACLEEGQWFFAMRTQQMDYDPDVEPTFGYRRAFNKPTDWVMTSAMCSDEFLRVPVTRYSDEAGYWYSDIDTMYVKFVSSDASYGQNLALWPRSFTELVAAHFAWKIAMKITNAEKALAKAASAKDAALLQAKNKALMAGPTSFPAQGAWSLARTRWGGRRRDGGTNGGGLIG